MSSLENFGAISLFLDQELSELQINLTYMQITMLRIPSLWSGSVI